MKRFCGLLLFVSLLVIVLPVYASFDVSLFEDSQSEYSEFFDVAHEKDFVFISAELTNEERSFDHKNNTKYYYSLIYPDLLVRYPDTSKEYVIPRIWIYYRSEKEALNVSRVEIKFEDKEYSFEIDDADISMLGDKTHSEEIVLFIGKNSADLMFDWYDAAIAGQNIWVTLKGKSEEISFSVPQDVVGATALMFSLYAEADGFDTLDDVIETPVAVKIPEVIPERYVDSDNKISFIIPEGWVLNPSKDKWDVLRATFKWESPDKTKESQIQYAAADIWKQIVDTYGPRSMIGCTRSMLDNSLYTKADFAEMCDTSTSNVQLVRYGDKEYYKTVVERSESRNGFKITFDMTIFLHVYNGYQYQFHFVGDPEGFSDFELLLESVRYQ